MNTRVMFGGKLATHGCPVDLDHRTTALVRAARLGQHHLQRIVAEWVLPLPSVVRRSRRTLKCSSSGRTDHSVANCCRRVGLEVSFLNDCERGGGSVTACSCTLNWLEWHVPVAQMVADANYYGRTGIMPADFGGVVQVCCGE